MAFEIDFLELMQSVASIQSPTARNFFGEETLGTAVTFPCHITYRTKIVRTENDEDVTSNAVLQMPPPGFAWTDPSNNTHTVPGVGTDDRITLPDSTTRHVISVNTYTDEDGTAHHQSVELT